VRLGAPLPSRSRRAILAAGAALAALSTPCEARASGAWLASADLTPVEQRVAVAIAKDRTTTWTSLRFVAPKGPVGFVVPVPAGASVDRSSDAWLEALDLATALRVFPPPHTGATCPGADAGAGDRPFHLVSGAEHVPSVAPAEVTVLDGAGAVAAWAEGRALSLAGELAADLGATGAPRFVAVRLDAPGGQALAPTLRIVAPTASPALPLALVRSGAAPLRVTAWVIGAGRGGLEGVAGASIDAGKLAWLATKQRSNYADVAADALEEAGPAASLVEAASHAALAASTPIDDGRAAIDGVVLTYLERAIAYGDAEGDGTACVAATSGALASTSPAGVACPKGALVASDGAACAETEGPGLVSPAALRCGAADDLAVALAGVTPADAWLTRHAMLLPGGARGVDRAIALDPSGAIVVPVDDAAVLDASGCPLVSGGAGGGGQGTGATGHGPSGSGSGSSGQGQPVGGGEDTWDEDDGESGSPLGVRVSAGGSCDGSDTSGTADDGSSDSCDGDTASTDETTSDGCSSSDGSEDAASDDACDGDSSSSSGGDSCDSDSSGSSGGDSCDSGSSGSSGSSGCSGSSSGSSGGDCSVHAGDRGGHRRPLRASPTAMALFAALALLRRARRPERDGARRARDQRVT
jgi:hypothetical protein